MKTIPAAALRSISSRRQDNLMPSGSDQTSHTNNVLQEHCTMCKSYILRFCNANICEIHIVIIWICFICLQWLIKCRYSWFANPVCYLLFYVYHVLQLREKASIDKVNLAHWFRDPTTDMSPASLSKSRSYVLKVLPLSKYLIKWHCAN